MKKTINLAMICLLFFTASASVSFAEVKTIEMRIAGYLCGN
jgi:hypothetical protein